MEASSEEYSAFMRRVKKTIYIDNLSPQATEAVVKAALGQFGEVVNIDFAPNYLHPELPRVALVEMSTAEAARQIIADLTNSPFMISGMPRPVRVLAAEPEMFDDRPKKPGRKITICWLKADDPRFEEAKKIKNLIRKQAAESNYLLKRQLEEEEKLSNQQSETLKANCRKFDLIEGVFSDNSAKRLAQGYGTPFSDA